MDEDEDWNLAHIYSVDEIQIFSFSICESPKYCKNVACRLWKSDKDNIFKTCYPCQEEEFGGWPEGLEPQDQANKICITQYCSQPPTSASASTPTANVSQDSTSIVDMTEEETSTVEESSATSSTATGWSCTNCTYINKVKAKKCEICGNNKSPKKR